MCTCLAKKNNELHMSSLSVGEALTYIHMYVYGGYSDNSVLLEDPGHLFETRRLIEVLRWFFIVADRQVRLQLSCLCIITSISSRRICVGRVTDSAACRLCKRRRAPRALSTDINPLRAF